MKVVGRKGRQVLDANRARRAQRQSRPSTAKRREVRLEAQDAVESQPWIADAITRSKELGLDLTVTPIGGKASGLHFVWKRDGVLIANYWPTGSRVDVGCRRFAVEDVNEAISVIVEQLAITNP